MELFFIFIPLVIVPLGIDIAGLWWLMADHGGNDDNPSDQDFPDGGF